MEKLTVYDLIRLASENFDEVEKIWLEIPENRGTLLEATLEWARRQGRDIQVITGTREKE